MEPALAQSLESIKWIEDATMKIDKAYATMVSTDIDFTGASINAPADVTAMIQSPSFSVPDPNDPSKELSSIKGWVTTEGNTGCSRCRKDFEGFDGPEAVCGFPGVEGSALRRAFVVSRPIT